MKALILAAGKSTRIASISKEKPKPLLEVAGMPVLAHNIKLLAQHGVHDIFINLHYQPQMIRAAIGDGSRWNARVRYSYEPEILGTAGAVKNLEKEFSGETFIVAYGDNFTDCNIGKMVAEHRQKKNGATIAVYDYTRAKHSGIIGGKIVCDTAKKVSSFVEGPMAAASESRYVNAGIYVLEPSVLSVIPPGFSDFGKDIFPKLLQQNQRLGIYEIEGYCLAIDNPEAYANTQKFAQSLSDSKDISDPKGLLDPKDLFDSQEKFL